MQCEVCGHVCPGNTKTCPVCGWRFAPTARTKEPCPVCFAEMARKDACPACGFRRGEAASTDELRAAFAGRQRDMRQTNVRAARSDEQQKPRAADDAKPAPDEEAKAREAAERRARREAARRARERAERSARGHRLCWTSLSLVFLFLALAGVFSKPVLLALSTGALFLGMIFLDGEQDVSELLGLQIMALPVIGLLWLVSAIPADLALWGGVAKVFWLAAFVIALVMAFLHPFVDDIWAGYSLAYVIVQVAMLALCAVLCAAVLLRARADADAGQLLAAFGPTVFVDSVLTAVWLLHYASLGLAGADRRRCFATQLLFAAALALIGGALYLRAFGAADGLQLYAMAIQNAAGGAVRLLFG